MAKNKKTSSKSKGKSAQINNLHKANLEDQLTLIDQFEKNYKATVQAGNLIKDQMQYEKISITDKIQKLKLSVASTESSMSSILKKEVRNVVGRPPPLPPCKNESGIINNVFFDDYRSIPIFDRLDLCSQFENTHKLLAKHNDEPYLSSPMLQAICSWMSSIMSSLDARYPEYNDNIQTKLFLPKYPFDGPAHHMWDWHTGWPEGMWYVADPPFGENTEKYQAIDNGDWKFLHIGKNLYVPTYNAVNHFGNHDSGTGAAATPGAGNTSPFYPIEAVIIGLTYKTLQYFSNHIYDRWNYLRDNNHFTFNTESELLDSEGESPNIWPSVPYKADDGLRIFHQIPNSHRISEIFNYQNLISDNDNTYLDISQLWIDKFSSNGELGSYTVYRSGPTGWGSNSASGFIRCGRDHWLVSNTNRWRQDIFKDLLALTTEWWKRIRSGQGHILDSNQHNDIKDKMAECARTLSYLSGMLTHETFHTCWSQYADRGSATRRGWGDGGDMPPVNIMENWRPYIYPDFYRGSDHQADPDPDPYWYPLNNAYANNSYAYISSGTSDAPPITGPAKHGATTMWGQFIRLLLRTSKADPDLLSKLDTLHDAQCAEEGGLYSAKWCSGFWLADS